MSKKEDLGLVVATKEEAFWIEVKKDTTQQLEGVEKQVKFLTAIIEMAKKKIAQEKDSNA